MSVTVTRSKLANSVKRCRAAGGDPATDEDVATARRDHAAEKLHAYVERIVADAPPLTDEQRSRLAGLLRGAEPGVRR